MSNILDRVDMALMNGGIVSDPLVENFINLISEAGVNTGNVHLQKFTSPEHDLKTSAYPKKFLGKVSSSDDRIYLAAVSGVAFQQGDLDGIALVSDTIARLYDVNLAEYGLESRDLDSVANNHIKELSNFNYESQEKEEKENKPQALHNKQFRQSTINLLNDVISKSKSDPTKARATYSLNDLQKKGYGVSKEPEEELEPEAEAEEDWVGQDPEDEDWVGQDPEDEGWVDDDDEEDDDEAIGPEEAEELRQLAPQDVADVMGSDDPAEALRQKVARRDPDLTTAARMEPRPRGKPPTREPEEEGEEHGLDIKVGKREPEPDDEDVDKKERIARDKIQILRSTDDQVLIRVKAMKRDKPGGELFRTYRFMTINRDDVDDWSLTGMWEHLKNMSSKAQSDPEYAKQFKSMYSTNLKDAYGSFDKPATNFKEYLENLYGGSVSVGLMKAYARNDPQDQYRLSGVISSLDDATVHKIWGDLRPRVKVDTDRIIDWIEIQKKAFENKGIEENEERERKEIINEATLKQALLKLFGRSVDNELIELVANTFASNTMAQKIMRNPSMLKRYGVDVPAHAKTRDERFKQWYKQEVGKGNIGRMTPEREAQYRDMFMRKEKSDEKASTAPDAPFGQEKIPRTNIMKNMDPRTGRYLEPWDREPESDKYDKDIDDEFERSLRKELASKFSKIITNPAKLEAIKTWIDKEAKSPSANLSKTEYKIIHGLLNATANDTLAKYIDTIYHQMGSESARHTLKRISLLIRQI